MSINLINVASIIQLRAVMDVNQHKPKKPLATSSIVCLPLEIRSTEAKV